jgi:hypothetical protein
VLKLRPSVRACSRHRFCVELRPPSVSGACDLCTLRDLDALVVPCSVTMATGTAKNRFRDQKGMCAHFQPMPLALTLSKAVLMRIIVHANHENKLELPEGAVARTTALIADVAPTFAKDVVITSGTRGLEHVAKTLLTAKRAGQLMRGARPLALCRSGAVPLLR